MDDDILGSLTTKKKPLSQTLPAKTSDAKKPPTPSSASKSKFSIDDIMGDDGDNLDSILSSSEFYLHLQSDHL